MVGNTKDKLAISVIRWIGLLPVALLAYLINYAISKFIYGFGLGRFLDVDSSLYNIISEWACSLLAGASAVYIAALVAPTHKKHASIILTTIIIIYSIISFSILKIDMSYMISIMATIIGAILITVAILYNYLTFNTSCHIINDNSDMTYIESNDDVTEYITDNAVSHSITMEAIVKFHDLETSPSRVLLCPICGESYPVPPYGKIVMSCYKCKTRFEHG